MTRSTSVKRLCTPGRLRDRPQVRVEVERLAQPDVDAGEALADRRRDGPLSATLLRRIESSSSAGSDSPSRSNAIDAGVVALPLDVDAGRLEDAARPPR